MNTNTPNAATAPTAVLFPDTLADSPDEWGTPFLFDPADYATLDYEHAAWFEFNGGDPDDDWHYEADMTRAPGAAYELVAVVGGRAVYREIDRPARGCIVHRGVPDEFLAGYCYLQRERGDVDDLRREIGDPTAPADDAEGDK